MQPGAIRIPHDLIGLILEHDLAPPAGVWLVLHAGDGRGRGVVDLARALEIAGGPELVDRGAGLFWSIDQDHGRIFLRSAGKVLNALQPDRPPARRLRRSRGVPVPVPELVECPEAALRAAWEAI